MCETPLTLALEPTVSHDQPVTLAEHSLLVACASEVDLGCRVDFDLVY